MTLTTGSHANCAPGSGGTYSAQVLADYRYDYLDRMTGYRSFATNGSTSTKDDASDHAYDALDRVLEQTESHGATGSPRKYAREAAPGACYPAHPLGSRSPNAGPASIPWPVQSSTPTVPSCAKRITHMLPAAAEKLA